MVRLLNPLEIIHIMAGFEALNSKARKTFYALLRETYGLHDDWEFEGLLFKTEKGKYYLLDRKFIDVAEKGLRTRLLGIYIAEVNNYGEIRLSFEGSDIVGPHATKNIVMLDETQMKAVMSGQDFEIEGEYTKYQLLIYEDTMKHYLGCSKIKNGTLFNFVPKSRRVNFDN
jgi:NOL1/NOP2/fmu family ribosome biogenesis protein